jgi:hypothetical protein
MTGTKKVLLGCGIVALVLFLAVVVLIIGYMVKIAGQPESGVKFANEMDKYALTYLDHHKILLPSEELLAYFDETNNMDGSEAVVLTAKRLIYIKDNHTTVMALASVRGVSHQKDIVHSDLIDVTDSSGKIMHIEIAPFNGGERFLTALLGAWKRENPKAEQANKGA